MGEMSGRVTVTVESAAEFKEAQKHANALGLSLDETQFDGNWEDNEGDSVFLSGSSIDVEKVGHTYFHLPLSGPDGTKVYPCKPVKADKFNKAGSVRVTFSG